MKQVVRISLGSSKRNHVVGGMCGVPCRIERMAWTEIAEDDC